MISIIVNFAVSGEGYVITFEWKFYFTQTRPYLLDNLGVNKTRFGREITLNSRLLEMIEQSLKLQVFLAFLWLVSSHGW